MEAAILTISEDPFRFQSVGQEIRIFRLPRFPYYVYYHYSRASAALIIYAVAHHSREPDYWRKRLP